MKKIVVWYNPNKKLFYYKIVSFRYNLYLPGNVNSYGHIIVIVIDNIQSISFHKQKDYAFKGIDWDKVLRKERG